MSIPLIEARRLGHSYRETGPVFQDIDLQIYPGERVALCGANGAGKTTLLRILVGLIRPTTGEVFAFGSRRNDEAAFTEVRRRVGFLFQDPDDQLFCPTVLEDVCFGPLNLGKSRREAIAIASRVLEQLGMAGYEQRITHQLSGGEKRMITLAGVLAMGPDLLLLDEPSNALDDAARARLIETLQGLPQAMLIVSHDRDLLNQIAGRSIRLDQQKCLCK